MKKEISREGNWIIEFETNNEKFYLYHLNNSNKEIHGTYDSYENVNKAIDRAEIIKKKKIGPLPFINRNNWNNCYEKGKITSIADNNYGLFSVWVSINKSRSKTSNNLLKDIIQNEEILQKIKELHESINKERKKMVFYTEDELKTHFEQGAEK